jgi:ABC-type transport system substrate-binding protein
VKWFTYNLAEARKLLEAAGQSIPFQTSFSFANDPSRTAEYEKEREVLAEMLQMDGVTKLRINTLNYCTEFRDQIPSV